ncbi:MAG: ACR3 family arsenite efflux transporter [Candidatus Sericytochromatia bacterium]|nr:ACR3 family arsenite efflux transporter [Candidatus Sericytochromatia bacterium]
MTTTASTPSVVASLSLLDRYLPLWIFVAMGLGIGLGQAFPGLGAGLDTWKVAGVSAPIALGLFTMMFPVLARVRYEALGAMQAKGKVWALSLVLNWGLGPALMFTLAWVMLPDHPAYRTGLVMVGLARCIAMVLLWNDLARGDREVGAVLVALNSLFQIAMYAVLGWFYLTVLPTWLGGTASALDVSMGRIAASVGVFLGVPFALGALTRALGVRARGRAWYDGVLMPRLAPLALGGLLYTIVLMFAMQGAKLLQLPLDVLRIALPLLAYFAVMFTLALAVSEAAGLTYEDSAALAFTAAGNNFELAIAVAAGLFGIGSAEALAAVVGPLIEVPALVALVYVALWLKGRWPHGPHASSGSSCGQA